MKTCEHPECGCDEERAKWCATMFAARANTAVDTVDISLAEAEEFLAKHGRHYKAPVEPICAIAVRDGSGIHGAAILGRREAGTGELAHIYVDGVSQGYSVLYGACWRALKALGYKKAVL